MSFLCTHLGVAQQPRRRRLPKYRYGTTEKEMGLVIESLSLDETLGPNRWKGCAEPCRKTPNSVNVGF